MRNGRRRLSTTRRPSGADHPSARASAPALGQLRRLLAFVRLYRGRLAIALSAIVVSSVLGLAGPYMIRFLVDAIVPGGDAANLNTIAAILIGIFCAQSVFYFIRGYLLTFIGERVMADLRIRLFEHLQNLSLSFFNERRTGELVSRLTNDVSTVRALVTSDISTALSQALTFVGALILIIVTDWRLTLFILALIPAAGGAGGRVRAAAARNLCRRCRTNWPTATTVVEEALGGVRVVSPSRARRTRSARYRDEMEQAFAWRCASRASRPFGPLMSFLGFAGVVVDLRGSAGAKCWPGG